MRILILMLALCVSLMADVPNGTAVTQTVTINSAYVSETSTDFLLQFKVPRTGDILANCTSAANVAMTNLNDTLRRARWVVYTADTLYVYAHTAKSTSANTVYRLHYGKTLNEVNSSSTFTNCGVINYFGMDIGSTSMNDYVTGASASLTNATLESSFFCRGMSSEGTGYATANSNISASLSSKTKFQLSFIFKPNSFAIPMGLFASQVSTTQRVLVLTNTAVIGINLNNGLSDIAYITLGSAGIVAGNYYHVVFKYDGSGISDTDKLKICVNGVDKNLTFYSSPPTISPALTGGTPYIGRFTGGYLNGVIDAFAISEISENCLDRYRALFTSTFWTLGTPEPVNAPTTSGSRRIGYRQVNMGQGMH